MDNPAKAETLQIREMEPSQNTRNIPQRIRSLIPVGRCVGKFSDANAIENNEYQLSILQ